MVSFIVSVPTQRCWTVPGRPGPPMLEPVPTTLVVAMKALVPAFAPALFIVRSVTSGLSP